MAKGITETAPKKDKPRITINVHVNKDHPLYKAFNLKGLTVGKPHSLQLHGKITSVSEDEYGKSLGLEVSRIGEKGEGTKGDSVGDIIKELHEKKASKKGGAEEGV